MRHRNWMCPMCRQNEFYGVDWNMKWRQSSQPHFSMETYQLITYLLSIIQSTCAPNGKTLWRSKMLSLPITWMNRNQNHRKDFELDHSKHPSSPAYLILLPFIATTLTRMDASSSEEPRKKWSSIADRLNPNRASHDAEFKASPNPNQRTSKFTILTFVQVAWFRTWKLLALKTYAMWLRISIKSLPTDEFHLMMSSLPTHRIREIVSIVSWTFWNPTTTSHVSCFFPTTFPIESPIKRPIKRGGRMLWLIFPHPNVTTIGPDGRRPKSSSTKNKTNKNKHRNLYLGSRKSPARSQ